MAAVDLTAARLREVLLYEPVTGIFLWLAQGCSGRAGRVNKRLRYRIISIDGRTYYEHRLAWLYMRGCWPDCAIDHRNRVRDDNRFDNLREAPGSTNGQNWVCGVNKTGFPGVSRLKGDRAKPFLAKVRVGDEVLWFDTFERAEDAHAAYLEHKRLLHPGFNG